MKLNIRAQSSAELLTKLSKVDITVPSRTEHPTTAHCENWSICRFLSSFAEDALLSYPVELKPHERPDFLLAGTQQVGIEVTQAGHQDYSWALTLAAREPGAIIEQNLFSYGNMLTADQKRQGIKPFIGHETQPLIGPGWQGNQREREWVKYVMDSVRQKSDNLSKPGYLHCGEDWLLIYDSTPLTDVRVDDALVLLTEALSETWQTKPSFSQIFIEVPNWFLHINARETRKVPLRDNCIHA